MGIDKAPSTRHGGGEHQYWKERVAAKFKEDGYTVQEEYPIGNGKTVDLVARKDGKTIAIEIETGKSDALANVRKCLNAGLEMVICAAIDARAQGLISRAQEKMDGDNHDFKIVTTEQLLSDAIDRGARQQE